MPSKLAGEAPSAAAFSACSSKSENRVAIPCFCFAPADERPLDDPLEGQAEPLSRMAERVEGARLGERLDSSLVQRARIDSAAEVVEVDEGATAFAGGDDVLDNGLPDVAHRGEAEDDHVAAGRAWPWPFPGSW